MKKLKTNPYRLVTQIFIIGLIASAGLRTIISKQYIADFEAFCPFGGIQAYASFLLNHSLACNMTNLQISMGLMLVIAVVVFSKLFCSVICPVGSVSEWIGKLGDRWKVRRSISGWPDKILRSLKYILLFITFYFTVNSSELFCKWFCPYFSVTSGFHPDVNILMATIVLVVVIFGSLFFRLFWCRYLCPINALANIFYFFSIFELGSLKNSPFPLFKIVRDPSTCTSCKLCSKACPHMIPVASLEKVRDVDCHLCGDCIQVCPEKGTLSINRSGKKWLPVLAVIILIITGVLFSRSFELPTVFEQWTSKDEMQEMSTYTISGLKSIKCYGSSYAFASHMYDMEGIYGVATYLKGQRAKIWYDADNADTTGIREWIFSPAIICIRNIPDDVSHIACYSLKVENFLDPLDGDLLAAILAADLNIFGLSTEFACPVEVSVYFAIDSNLSPDKLKRMVEERDIKAKSADNSAQKQNYKVREIENQPEILSRDEYIQKMGIYF